MICSVFSGTKQPQLKVLFPTCSWALDQVTWSSSVTLSLPVCHKTDRQQKKTRLHRTKNKLQLRLKQFYSNTWSESDWQAGLCVPAHSENKLLTCFLGKKSGFKSFSLKDFHSVTAGGRDFLLLVTCVPSLWKQTRIRKHGAFTRVACQSAGWRRWRGLTVFLPCSPSLCLPDGGRQVRASLSLGVLRVSAGLWGGTVREGRRRGTMMAAPRPWKAKVINSSICSLLTSALKRCGAGSRASPTMHQPVTILRKTWKRKNDDQMLYCLCNFHIISQEEKSLLWFNHAEWTWRFAIQPNTPAPPALPKTELLQDLTVRDYGLWNWLTHTNTHTHTHTVDVVEQIKRINLLTPPNIKLGSLI